MKMRKVVDGFFFLMGILLLLLLLIGFFFIKILFLYVFIDGNLSKLGVVEVKF